jgi:hypothetical protein
MTTANLNQFPSYSWNGNHTWSFEHPIDSRMLEVTRLSGGAWCYELVDFDDDKGDWIVIGKVAGLRAAKALGFKIPSPLYS